MKKYAFEIFVAIDIITFITIIVLGCFIPSKSELASDAMKDGRWELFEECIESHPSDFVCDSCWTVIIEQKNFKPKK